MKTSRRAFTLVELLVSMTILLVISLLVVRMLGDVMRIWTNGNQKYDIYQTTRATIEILGRELSIAEPLPAQMQGNYRSFASSPLVINPPLSDTTILLKDATAVPMDSLFFYAPLKITSKGPLVCVGYFVKNDHTLQRLAITSADTTYPAMAAANLKVYFIWNAAPSNSMDGRTLKNSEFIQPVGWLNPTTGNGFAQAAVNKSVTSSVADRVLGFMIRPIGKDGAPLPSSLLPSTAPTFTSGTTLARAYNSSWWPVADALPTQIEITLAVCDEPSYTRLKNLNTLPLLAMPTDNSDSALQTKITNLKNGLNGKVNQYAIVTRRFPLIRGTR